MARKENFDVQVAGTLSRRRCDSGLGVIAPVERLVLRNARRCRQAEKKDVAVEPAGMSRFFLGYDIKSALFFSEPPQVLRRYCANAVQKIWFISGSSG